MLRCVCLCDLLTTGKDFIDGHVIIRVHLGRLVPLYRSLRVSSQRGVKDQC